MADPPPKSNCPSKLQIACKEYIDQEIAATGRQLQLQINAIKDQIHTADEVLQARLGVMNEVRGQLKDQVSTFVPRTELDARFSSITNQVWTFAMIMIGAIIAALLAGVGYLVSR